MTFLNYVFAPKLFMEYGRGSFQKIYEPGGLEKYGDRMLSMLSMMWSIGYYTSPLIVTYLYRRGYLVADSISSLAKFTTSIGIIVVLSLCMRGFGRSQSRAYNRLVRAIELSKNSRNSEEAKKTVKLFDFDFKYWAVDFDVGNVQSEDKPKPISSAINTRQRPFWLSSLPCEIAAYIAIHTFGIRMIYPGSVKLLQAYMRPMLIAGRAKLVQEHQGARNKVKSIDNNEIDTMFIDNRNKSANGNTLVVCSEGNAGFYEIGVMSTPIGLKYSVLGWNHPGFDGSSGKPFPQQDQNAIDAVIQFALNVLGFAIEDILLFGWSIGGYSSIWAATQYPGVKGLILDGTFDDILQLAQPRMPTSLSSIVKLAIRDYVNLHNSELIMGYNGPVILIRRTDDEVIAEDGRIETNRGNFLLLNLLKYRYPNIFQAPQIIRIKSLLSKPIDIHMTRNNEEICMARLTTYASDKGKIFPMQIGEDYTNDIRTQMAEFLVNVHISDFKSTHCTPLPGEYFVIPWDIPIEQGLLALADLQYFRTLISNFVEDKGDCSNSKFLKEICDENQIMLQLAKIYIISPEKVLLLLTSESLTDTCSSVSSTLEKINKTQTGCIPLNADNLYMKLLKTVEHFYKIVCEGNCSMKKKIMKIGDCLPELRDEFLDCEGAADWYENTNHSVCCHIFNDIVNCNYVKTAMLCGLESAATIRSFTTDLFQHGLPPKSRCKVSRSLPRVDDPMPSSGNRSLLSRAVLQIFQLFVLSSIII